MCPGLREVKGRQCKPGIAGQPCDDSFKVERADFQID